MLDWILQQIPESQKGHFSELSFSVYDRHWMLDGPDGKANQNPDISGTAGDREPKERTSWRKVPCPVEVKDDWAKALLHCWTYGRSVLELTGRWYSVVLAYNFKKQEIRFCFCLRMGLSVTPAFRLFDKDGFENVVQGLSGIASSQAEDAGIDLIRQVSDRHIFVNLPAEDGKGSWSLVERICLLGRATHVYSIERVDGPLSRGVALGPLDLHESDDFRVAPSVVPIAPAGNYVCQHSARLPRKATRASNPSSTSNAQSRDQDYSHPSSGKKGQSGNSQVPKFNASPPPVSLPLAAELDGALSPPTEPDEKFWQRVDMEARSAPREDGLSKFTGLKVEECKASAFPTAHSNLPGKKLRPKLRSHGIDVFRTPGISFTTQNNPLLWVYGAVDGMIGHLQLFMKGILHRDVSIGNVLLRSEPQDRTEQALKDECHPILSHPRFAFLATHLSKCHSFIHDLDQSVKWKDERELANHRSGTLEFMSRRLMEHWADGEDCLHTAIDDLESFVWLVVWSAFHSAGGTRKMKKWAGYLSQDSVNALAKGDICDSLGRRFKCLDRSDFSDSFNCVPLLNEWILIAQEAYDAVQDFFQGERETDRDTFHDGLEKLCLKYYAKYLEKGVEFLQENKVYEECS